MLDIPDEEPALPATSTNRSPGSPHIPYPITPEVQMLNIPNEESLLQSNIFPSHSHEVAYMSIDDNDDNDNDENNSDDNGDEKSDSNNSTDIDDDDDDDDTGPGDEEGDTNQSLETVFRHPSHPAAATVDLDTEPECSDEEDAESHQQILPNRENSRHLGTSTTQTGRYHCSVINYIESTKQRGFCCR